MAKYVFKCDCGRTVEVFLKDGKVTHKIKGTGDALLDALGGVEETVEETPAPKVEGE